MDWEYFEFYTRYSYFEYFFIFSESFNSIQVPRYFSWVSFFGLSNIINYRFDSFNFRSIFLVCSSLCFTRINFDLSQHCLFYALTLQLFISSACYKQTSVLVGVWFMLVFGYFKAFWRVFVWFRCSLSSLVKIMRRKA